ncbi:helix-turn-helix domain-containing protein [Delftia lacustris]|uniref:helix-turn-helix domain-containing protein n=1 Tax=Delftia lacustris TaxID=558537 RepID=UPI001EEFE275|nr:helix-turn-helix domain-containing protein [Delftia lacustris]
MPSGQAPPPALQPHFQCLWSSTVAPDYAGGFLVVPDGCVDIVCKGGQLLAVGPDRVAARPALVPGSEVWGRASAPVRPAPGWACPWTRSWGRRWNWAICWGRAREWVHRINDAQPGAGQAVFIHGLVQMGRDAPEPDRQAMQLFGVAAAAGRDESGVLAAMRAQLSMSERSLRRLCHAQFGYGPKTLERVLRFQRLLALARSDRQAGLAALAAEAGYADQAHLSREVRALCGITPRAALQQLLD